MNGLNYLKYKKHMIMEYINGGMRYLKIYDLKRIQKEK